MSADRVSVSRGVAERSESDGVATTKGMAANARSSVLELSTTVTSVTPSMNACSVNLTMKVVGASIDFMLTTVAFLVHVIPTTDSV